jgi:hypothetical protein
MLTSLDIQGVHVLTDRRRGHLGQGSRQLEGTGYSIPGTIFQAYRAAQGTRSEGFELEVHVDVLRVR